MSDDAAAGDASADDATPPGGGADDASVTARPRRSRWRRWGGLLGLSLRRLFGGAARPGLSRVSVSILVVAVAVAIFVTVGGLSLGIATQQGVGGADADYWITPESADTLTTVMSVDGPRLGDVHATSADLEAHEDVARATPMLVELVELRTEPGADAEYVLAIGVVPSDDGGTVAGVATDRLAPGDPYYAGGSYDGRFTGDVVLSPAAAELLDAAEGESLLLSQPGPGVVDQSFSVAGTSEQSAQSIQGDLPVAVFQLSELQAFTGADAGDQADQILVSTTSESAPPALEDAYDHATVVERGAPGAEQLFDDDLALAIGLSALLVALVMATLVITTTAAIEVEADRRQLAVFAALGLSARSTTGLVVIRTLVLALLGGLLGAVLGSVGIVLVNAVVAPYFGLQTVALLSARVAVAGVGLALCAGLLAAPYPVLLARRTATLGELTG